MENLKRMKDLNKYYLGRIEKILAKKKIYDKKSRLFLILKLGVFTSFLVCFYISFANLDWFIGGISVVSFFTYLYIYKGDIKNQKFIIRLQAIIDAYKRELNYLKNDFSAFDDGRCYLKESHAYALDLDILGKDSLYNRINRTITPLGSKRLAEGLLNFDFDKKKINDKQNAIHELAEKESWRTEFLSFETNKNFNIANLLNFLKSDKIGSNIAKDNKQLFLSSKITPYLLISSNIILLLFIILSLLGIFPSSLASVYFLFQMACTVIFAKSTNRIIKEISGINKDFRSYVDILHHIKLAKFNSEYNRSLYKKLFNSKVDSLEEFSSFNKILNSIERRNNIIVYFLFNGAFFFDLWVIIRFNRWKSKNIENLNLWIDIIAEYDSLISKATYEFNTPAANRAKINNSDEFLYKAKALYHPFLNPKDAVANDFDIKNSSFYIITGANMAGKSTFLRSIGINYILAMNSMPVCARDYEVSFFNLFSSMRTSDNLSNNISYFNAELLRLEDLITACKANKYTLIILDEILKGTNSIDKLNGSRLFLKEISKLPVSGIIATHDLELSKLEEEAKDKFINYCFEIELSDNIQYSYAISKGVARNLNASFLLDKIIKRI